MNRLPKLDETERYLHTPFSITEGAAKQELKSCLQSISVIADQQF